jgi:hypothetical protein
MLGMLQQQPTQRALPAKSLGTPGGTPGLPGLLALGRRVPVAGVTTIGEEILKERFQAFRARTTSLAGTVPTDVLSSRATPRQTNGRSRELAWRRDHAALLRRLAGEWVVVEGSELVGHGPEPAPLVAEARQRGIRIPYVFFVEPADKEVIKLGL